MTAREAASATGARRWSWGWAQLGAVAGIAFGILLLTNLLIGHGRPDADATTEVVRRYFVDHRRRVLASAEINGLLALAFVWFSGSLRGVLRGAATGSDTDTEALTTLLFGGAVGAAVLVLVGSAARAALAFQTARAGEAGAVRALFDLDTMVFGLDAFPAVVYFGAAAAACLRTAAFPRWLGGGAAVIAVLTLIGAGSLGDPTGPLGVISLVAVLLLLIWVLATSVLLLWPRPSSLPPPRPPA